jgi:Putative zincin peptidase
MAFSLEEINDQAKFRLILTVPYTNLIQFVFEYLKKKSVLMLLYWFLCLIFLFLAVYIRINIAGNFPVTHILFHSAIGMIILPLLCIPVHELLHIVPYYVSGAKNIRIGMDLKQYLFYVTADKYVATPMQFRIVAWAPFIIISTGLLVLIYLLPGLWKWSLSVFLFAHATMCAGDFALLNLYYINKEKRIYTWDDFDKKEAYFYEELK